MYRNYDVIEVTKENGYKYLDGIVYLEEIVLNQMNKEGKVGQLFTTGREDLSEYINSKSNHVLVAVRNNDKIISSAYITEGQTPFTYNDITKYFKGDENYQEYIKSKYDSSEYPKVIRDNLNKIMSSYMKIVKNDVEKYQEFY